MRKNRLDKRHFCKYNRQSNREKERTKALCVSSKEDIDFYKLIRIDLLSGHKGPDKKTQKKA